MSLKSFKAASRFPLIVYFPADNCPLVEKEGTGTEAPFWCSRFPFVNKISCFPINLCPLLNFG